MSTIIGSTIIESTIIGSAIIGINFGRAVGPDGTLGNPPCKVTYNVIR